MGLIYAKNLKHARKKMIEQGRKSGETLKEASRFVVRKSKLKSEEKGYNLYVVTRW